MKFFPENSFRRPLVLIVKCASKIYFKSLTMVKTLRRKLSCQDFLSETCRTPRFSPLDQVHPLMQAPNLSAQTPGNQESGSLQERLGSLQEGMTSLFAVKNLDACLSADLGCYIVGSTFCAAAAALVGLKGMSLLT